jgi:hypothetical protein
MFRGDKRIKMMMAEQPMCPPTGAYLVSHYEH